MAVVSAPRYVRLFSQDDLDPIRRAMSSLDHHGHHSLGYVGPLWRLFQGHAADPYFRVGSCVALQTLLEASAEPEPPWHDCQTQGPQFLLKTLDATPGLGVLRPLDLDSRQSSVDHVFFTARMARQSR